MDNDDTSEPGDTWLVYWESDNGNSWQTPWVGVSSNPIADGGWNAWTATPAGDWPGADPIPEPVSLAFLAMSALMLPKRRTGRVREKHL
jgi:hypothetical protein